MVQRSVRVQDVQKQEESSGDVEGAARKCKAITRETKIKIIKRMDQGKKMVDVAHSYYVTRSSSGTVLKNKDKIMGHVKSAVPMKSTIMSKECGRAIEEMEELLCLLMQNKAKKGGERGASFPASHRWFNRVKTRAKLPA